MSDVRAVLRCIAAMWLGLLCAAGCSAPTSAEGGGLRGADGAPDATVDHGAELLDGATDAGSVVPAPLFNGRDLSGWVVVNGGPDTWRVQDSVIVCSGQPTGVLRSPRQYENFVLELDWRHVTAGGNSGLFIWSGPLPVCGQPFTRAIELQIMDGVETENYTSQGDVFSIQGARMTPDRPHPAGWERCLPGARVTKPSPAWNHYRVVARDGALTLEVNGVVVSGGHDCSPRKGYICLESEGSLVNFRNVRLAELPPSAGTLAPELVAEQALPFVPLFDGSGLGGWSNTRGAAAHWSAQDWTLASDGRGQSLVTDARWGDFELIADWRWPGAVPNDRVPIALRGTFSPVLPTPVPADAWQRVRVQLRGQRLTLELNGRELLHEALQQDLPASGPLGLLDFGQPVVFGNLYIREL